MAARLNGLFSVGIDSSKVAYSISSAKMVDVEINDILKACDEILIDSSEVDVPSGEFWEIMYDPQVLLDICKLRKSLLADCDTPGRIALRGLILGALHGPLRVDGSTSYFSNQFPRTFASKPGYSVKFWKKNNLLTPPKVNLRDIVEVRARRYYSEVHMRNPGFIINADSTKSSTFEIIRSELGGERLFDTVITSPPYHGMNTYIPDQWLRNWFVGGPDCVQYTTEGQTSGKLNVFVEQLNSVWRHCSDLCKDGANICVRFGDISRDETDPEDIIRKAFDGTGWSNIEVQGAGAPTHNRRASNSFAIPNLRDYKEIDVHAVLT